MLASWVADMDFPTAPAIREAVARRAAGDLGYPTWFDESEGGPLGEVFAERTQRRFGHTPDPTHVRLFTDINQAMLATLQRPPPPARRCCCTPRPAPRSSRSSSGSGAGR